MQRENFQFRGVRFALFVLALALGVGSIASPAGKVSAGISSSNAPHGAVTLHSAGAACPAWAIVSSPNDGPASNVLTGVSAVSPTEVWAVGYTVIGDQVEKTLAMRWSGREWSIVPSPNPGQGTNYFNGVAAISANDVWAIGSSGTNQLPVPFIVHWDGQTWTTSRLPELDPSGNDLYAIWARSATDIWAVGSIGSVESKTERSLIMHYNGVDWQVVPQRANGLADALFGVSGLAANDAWAVGYVYRGGTRTEALAQHWNGTEWVETSPPETNASRTFSSVAVLAPNNVWAAGYRSRDRKNYLTFDQWDGSRWREVAAPNPSEEGNALFGISGSAANDIWAVGYFLASGVRRSLLMHYDGSTWAQAAPPDDGSGPATLYGVVTPSGGDPIAVGYIVRGPSSARTLVERYSDPCAPPPPTPTSVPAPPTPTTAPAPVPTVQIPGTNSRAFNETGKTVRGLFLDYWDKNGGLPQQGFPISDVLGEVSALNGKPYTVQYFERAVFEYHPENQPPFDVLLSQLGTFRYKQKYPTGAPNQKPNQTNGRLFTETGHWVGGKFLEYWNKNGGLAQQGFPISDEFTEKSDLNGKEYTVQYFERAVFEYHPENQPPFDVLLSQLGTFQFRQKYGNR